MKNCTKLPFFGLLSLVLSLVPTSMMALTMQATYNSSSTISNGQYLVTCNDGTVLGFYKYSNTAAYFTGAITDATAITVPDTIVYSGNRMAVTYCGRSSNLDFDEAPNVTSITLPATVSYIYAFPATVSELHLQSTTPPGLSDNKLLANTIVYVPESLYAVYLDDYVYSYLKTVYEGWTPKSYAVSVASPGQFGNELLNVMEKWDEVVELVITGTLNAEDMAYFSRLRMLQKLDLSQTDIMSIDGCSNLNHLETVILPSTASTIEESAFSGCSRLSSINVTNVQQILDNAFYGCNSLPKMDFSSVTYIGDYAFYDCDSLTDVDFPVAAQIGKGAFSYCSSLTDVDFPVATQIGGGAFSNCPSLTDVDLPVAAQIGEGAFSYCSSLTSIDLQNVTAIGNSTFSVCTNLKTVTIPNVSIIGSSCFYNCTGLTDIDLSCITEIGPEAFRNCTSLKKVDLSSVVNFGTDYYYNESYAFRACRSLKEAILPKECTSIPNGLFYECDSLTSVTIPEGCTYIGYNAFHGCPLETISIPSTITTIQSDAFSSSVVKDLYCHVIVPFETSVFDNMQSATLHVPEFSINAYRLHDDWYNFAKTVAIEGNIERMTFTQDYSIYEYKGLADNVDLTLSWKEATSGERAHLTVNANSTFDLGVYKQYQNLYSSTYDDRYYDYDLGQYVYVNSRNPYCTTLITQNEITADSICTYAYLPTNRWSFISFPYDVNVLDIVVPEGTLWVIRKYSGEDRAAMTGNTWQNMIDGTVLKAGEGYIFHCYHEEGSIVEVQFPAADSEGTLFAYDDVVKTLAEYPAEFAHNRSWNLVGNPYPAYFNTQEIEFDAPITVWNGSGYTAYSLLDDNYVLSPNQAFFVQRPTTSATMTFRKEGRMHSATMAETEYAPSLSRARSASASRFVYNFLLTDTAYVDRARLVINEEAKMEYETNCDACKFMSSNTDVPQLYIMDGGVKYAIDERPLGNGAIGLGTYFGKAGEHTLTLASNPNEEVAVMLTDHLTGAVTNLTVDSYTFTAEVGTDNDRFTIALAPTTDIEGSMVDEAAISEIYTLDGKQVKDVKNLSSGAYIVKKGGEYVKHIVK